MTGAFSTTCTVYGDNCERWWLSGCHRSVVRTLAAQDRCPGFDSAIAGSLLCPPLNHLKLKKSKHDSLCTYIHLSADTATGSNIGVCTFYL